MKKILVLLTVMAACAASSVYAATPDASNPPQQKQPQQKQQRAKGNGARLASSVDNDMKAMDTNHDGSISKDEYTAAAAKAFDEADLNHDGMLTQQEIISYRVKKWQETRGPKRSGGAAQTQ